MYNRAAVVVAVLCLVCGAVGGSDVVAVSSAEEVDALTASSSSLTLLEFYATYCGHCKELKPKYEALASRFAGQGGVGSVSVTLAAVDASKAPALADAYAVTGLPTIYFIRNRGGDITTSLYKGTRSEQDLAAAITTAASDGHITVLGAVDAVDEFAASKTSDDGGLVYIVNAGTRVPQRFYELADALVTRMPCAVFVNASSSTQGGSDSKVRDIVGVYPAGASTQAEYFAVSDAVSVAEMIPQILGAQLPLALLITEDNYDLLYDPALASHTHVVILILSRYMGTAGGAVDRVAVIRAFEELAAQSRAAGRPWQFAVMDADDAATSAMADFGVVHTETMSNAPDAVLVAEAPFVDGGAQRWVMGGEFTRDSGDSGSEAGTFLRELAGGTLPLFVKSEPEPAKTRSRGLTTVVGTTFERLVMDPKRDVLVVFTRPGCKYCAQFAPMLEDIAFKARRIKTLVVATFNAADNDYPRSAFRVSGYPAVFLVPAGGVPIPFKGLRNGVTLMDFVAESAALPTTQRKARDLVSTINHDDL